MQPTREREHGSIQCRRGAALAGVEIGIARRQGEPVTFAHRGNTHDADIQPQLVDHALDDLVLLVILFAEIEPVRIHFRSVGHIDEIDAMRLELGDIIGFVARIGVEILTFAELGRIDEQAGNHHAAIAPRTVDQCEVAFVQRAHGRHQADQLARVAMGLRCRAQIGGGADDFQGGLFFVVGHGTICVRVRSQDFSGAAQGLSWRTSAPSAFGAPKQYSADGNRRARTSSA